MAAVERTNTILRLLAHQEGFITIDRIADSTGAGVRTIHRDLERLERTLALRGVRLERRRGLGVRLVDPLPESLESSGGGSPLERYYGGEQKPFYILLYLLARPGWTKLSELAHAFFVSDSSVSSYLSQAEQYLPAEVTVARQKGVGVRLDADEQTARFMFLTLFAGLIPPNLLLQPHNQGDIAAGAHRTTTQRLLDGIGFNHAGKLLVAGVTTAEAACGYRFSPSYFSLLYSYFFILRRRVPENGPIRRATPCAVDTPPFFRETAREVSPIILGDLIGTDIPVAETEMLAKVLSIGEPADIPAGNVGAFLGRLSYPIDSILEHTLGELEEREHIWLHDDQARLDYLRIIISAAIRRIALGLPRWFDFVTEDSPATLEPGEQEGARETGIAPVLVRWFLFVFRRELSSLYNSDKEIRSVVTRELREAILALEARLEALHQRRAGEFVVKIVCFEGLGMSSYLGTLARDVLPPEARVDIRWERPFLSESAASKYDLVISTFEIDLGATPVLVVENDVSPDYLRRSIRDAVQKILRQPGPAPGNTERERLQPPPFIGDDTEGVSPATIMSVIQQFFVHDLFAGVDILDEAVTALDAGNDCNRERLRADFERRETYGQLVFEDLGIQLLHCRSDGVPEPRAGVLRYPPGTKPPGEHEAPAILVLAAPVATPPACTRVLSELVVALTEYPGFPEMLAGADRPTIQAGLLSLFSRRA